jgi:O-antigen/teichoic acid export membrane protein
VRQQKRNRRKKITIVRLRTCGARFTDALNLSLSTGRSLQSVTHLATSGTNGETIDEHALVSETSGSSALGLTRQLLQRIKARGSPGAAGRVGAGMLDQVMASAGNFLLIIICAVSLPAAEQGQLAYAVALSVAARTLMRLSVTQTLFVEAPAQDRDTYSASMAGLALAVALVCAVLAAGLISFIFAPGVEGWTLKLESVCALSLFVFASALFDYQRAAALAFSSATLAAILSSAVFPLRALALWLVAPSEHGAALWVAAAVTLAPGVLMAPGLARAAGRAHQTLTESWAHLKHSRHLIASMPGLFLRNQSPVFLLGTFAGLSASGAYLTVRSVINLGNVGLEFLSTFLASGLGRLHAGDRAAYHRRMRLIAVLGAAAWLAGFIVLMIAGPWFLERVTGAPGEDLRMLLALLWGAMLFTFAERLSGIHLRQERRTAVLGWGEYVAAAVTIALITALAGPLHVLAAGYGVLAGALIIATLSLAVAIRHQERA